MQQAGSPEDVLVVGEGVQHDVGAGETAGAVSVIGTRAAPSSVSSISMVLCSASSAPSAGAPSGDAADSFALAAKQWASLCHETCSRRERYMLAKELPEAQGLCLVEL
jgi:hypothetical protein